MLTREEKWVLVKALYSSRKSAEKLLAQEYTIFRESAKEEIEYIDSIRKKLAL